MFYRGEHCWKFEKMMYWPNEANVILGRDVQRKFFSVPPRYGIFVLFLATFEKSVPTV